MISAVTFTITGAPGEKTNLPEKLFGTAVNEKLLAQAVRIYLSNQRKSHAKTKTRGEVDRTTAKMYKQKGTGRARHGSYGAPIFVGGGIAHGPTGTQNYKMEMPVKMAKSALLGALSDKAKNKAVVVIMETEKADRKTKEAQGVFDKVAENQKALLVTTNEQKAAVRGWKNLEKVTIRSIDSLNTYEVLKNKILLITAEAIQGLVKKYAA